jgi:hypothetical protein
MTIEFSTRRPIPARLLGASLALTVSLGFGLAAATPALADDDGAGSIFGTMLTTVTGIGKPKDVELPIEYRERSPLVVPPKRDLPPPVPGAAQRNAAWPNDPDVDAVRKAQALARAPAPLPGNGADKLSKEELMRGRIAASQSATPAPLQCEDLSRGCGSDPKALWDSLKIKKADGSADVALVPGVEPPREYLTQPPRGYLSPKKLARYNFDSPSGNFKDEDIGNAAQYTREHGRHRTSVDN